MKIAITFLLYIFITIAKVCESKYSISLEQKLIGGTRIPSGLRKCLASLRHNIYNLCSAFLISETHLLTAGHCLTDFLIKRKIPNFDEYSVQIGYFDWVIEGTPVKIKEIQVHNRYNPYNYSPVYDIGIITLHEPVVATELVNWISLANCTIIIGSEAEVLGWGSHTDKEELSALKKINVQLKSTEECGDSYENSIICAAHVAESDIFVDVDIGAPLIQNDQVIGILVEILPSQLAIFADIKISLPEIEKIQKENNTVKDTFLPRKRARFDEDKEKIIPDSGRKRKVNSCNKTERMTITNEQ